MKKLILLSLVLFIPAISFAAQKPMVLCAAKDGTIKAKLKCTKKETKLNLNSLKGAKGDKGDTGARGPKGDKGEKGDRGLQGATGAQGIRGPKGDKGDSGTGGTINSYGSMTALLESCVKRTVDGGYGDYDASTGYPQDVYVNANCENGEMLYSWEFGTKFVNNEPVTLPVIMGTVQSHPGVLPGGVFVGFRSSDGIYAIHPTVTFFCCKVQ